MRFASEFVRDGRVIFIFSVLVIAACAMGLTPVHALSWVVAILGFLAFWPMEYAIHRYLLHELPQLMPGAYRGHVAHHQAPKDVKYLLTPNRYNLTGHVLIIVIAGAITRNVNLTAAFLAGVCVGQLFYEWKHFVSHRPIVPLTPWGKAMKKRHLLHHHLDAEYWFGVSNPVFDYVMGTDIDGEEARKVRHARSVDPDAEVASSSES